MLCGGKMEDVIFVGILLCVLLGCVEVIVSIDNFDNVLFIEYIEVLII